jgi:SecD/SecF fusion protein
MQNMVWKLALIVGVLALCLLSLFGRDPRYGTDLRGGVSLVYKVSMPEEGAVDPQEILRQTITVLKERVNPTGVLDISMLPLGRDRIEIVMPLPNETVRELQRTYQLALRDLLLKSEIRAAELDDALRRGAAPDEIGGDPSSERGAKTLELQTAFDDQAAARAALEAAGSDASPEEKRRLQFAVAQAENAFEDLYEAVLQLSLGEPRVRRTLGLPDTPQELRNDDGSRQVDADGKPAFGPSQRETALAGIRAEFPQLAADLDATVAAFLAYDDERTGFDDPEDLIRMLRGAGVLDFRIGVAPDRPIGVDIGEMRTQLEEVGPENTVSPVARWYPINELKQWYENADELAALEANPIGYFEQRDLAAGVYEGEYHLLLYTTRDKTLTHGGDRPSWSITQTFPSADQLGRPAVSFNLDASGGSQMGRLTGANIGEPMAIVLDRQVYSAPVIRGAISTNGQISGNFSQEEVNYLTRVLAAGSLQARLSKEPIATNTVGPSIGQDNLDRGEQAFIISLVAVAIFMLAYYFFAGLVADFALLANGIIILGVMMGIDGTFTLPGLAGIVLTIGMAVDANVLIYERIREEIFEDELDLRGAVRQGYRKALSTILDANITNLIVCLVLFQTATTEVKGFALTLTIGICATLFTALFVTRQVFYLYTDVVKARKLPMLPTVFPAIHRALEPSINWIGFRKIFWTCSVIAVTGSVVMVSSRGVDMFDTEFRGGVSLTMLTAPVDENRDGEPDRLGPDGPERIVLRHAGTPTAVEERVRALGTAAAAGLTADASDEQRVLAQLESASILTAGETQTDDSGAIVASAFQVKVASPKGLDDDRTITAVVVQAIVEEFGDELDVTRPLTYDGATGGDAATFVFPITDDELGQNINVPSATERIPGFRGGAAVVLRNVEPPATVSDIEKRIDRMRNQPDFVQYSGRKVKVFGLTPAEDGRRYRDLAVCVYDEYRSFLKVDTELWFAEVAEPEWALIGTALQRPTSLEQVSSFSSAVAETLSAQAIVAVGLTLLGILVYIWVRFGSLRYSVAAIAALVHDVTIALGLLALTGFLGGTTFAAALLIEPFRIDLGVVAALLTIIGYSLNDTIVILDRIRENRGKLPLPTAPIVNRSINQTVSRTLLTSVTTLMAVLIMYSAGGSGIRPFTFCLLAGLIVGTYSSVAIAAPLVFTGSASAGGSGADAATSTPPADAPPRLAG